MKHYVLILAILFIPFVARANGAWERYVDAVLVELSAAPLSPLQGEHIGFILSFHDPETRTYLTNISHARYRIDALEVASYPNGGTIFESEPLVLTEGSAEFSFRFAESGIYDIHVLFQTQDGKKHEAGFLTSVRTVPKQLQSFPLPILLLGIVIGSLGGFMLAPRILKR